MANFMDPFFQGQADQRSIMMFGDQRRRQEEQLAMQREAQQAELARQAMMQNALASVLMPGAGGGGNMPSAPMAAPGASQGGGNALTGVGLQPSGPTANPPQDLAPIFQEAADAYGLSVEDLYKIGQIESRFNPNALSPAGAIGVMQLMPGTAKDLGVKNPWDVKENIFGGARYYKMMLDRYNGDKSKAVAAYNAGPGRVDNGGTLPRETQNYLAAFGQGGGQAPGNALAQPGGGMQGDKLNQLASIMMVGGEYGPAASLMSMAQSQQNKNRFQSVTNPETGQMTTFDPVTGQYGGAPTGQPGPAAAPPAGSPTMSADDPNAYLGNDPNGKPVLDYDGLNKLTGNRGNRIRELAMKAHDDRLKEYLRVSNQSKAPFEMEQEIRKEYVAQIKDFEIVANSYRTINAAAKNPDAVGDLSLIFAYMKMLDPGSVVRESEYATAEQARGVPASIINLYNKVLAGEKLAPEQRRDFVSRAKGLYQGRLTPHRERTGKYKRLAKQYGLSPDNVIAFDPALTDEEMKSGTAPTTSGPVNPAAMDRVNQMLYGIPPMDMVSPRRQ